MIKRLRYALRSKGLRGILLAIARRVYPPKSESIKIFQRLLLGKNGLEIGGPSPIFRRSGLVPVYPIVGRLDNCNFGDTTVWEGRLTEGLNFRYDKARPTGFQYICEATDLPAIPSGFYDFVLSSHVLEHTANPLKALQEWKRVLTVGGIMVLIVPHKDGTFDRKRPVTAFDHVVEDFQRTVGEDDLSHLTEILKFHDFDLDPQAGSPDQFKKRSERNFENRCLHHHVFDTELLIMMTNFMGFQICNVEPARPCHIVIVAQRPPANQVPENRRFLSENASYRHHSPFASDRSKRRYVRDEAHRSISVENNQ